MKYKFFLWNIIFFVLGISLSYGIYRISRHVKRLKIEAQFGLPPITTISLDSTNLPIMLVNTDGRRILRDSVITARMTIIDNGNGLYNYIDTILHPTQNIDYDGYIALRYRGNTSFAGSLKKPYAIRAIDMPIEMGGAKIKSQLLGMKKGKKWVLLAPYSDRSMIRDALTFELARNYMEYVPQTRFCEVILNGVYMGVHILTEQITADRLKIGKPNKKGNDKTGGYLFEIDRRVKDNEKNWPDGLILHSPEKDKLTSEEKQYVLSLWSGVDRVLTYGRRNEWLKLVDELSFIDFQLVEEFAYNVDGYNNSTFLYKYSNIDDGRLRMVVWDFNGTYGNCNIGDGWVTDNWHYKRVIPSWWSHMTENEEYRARLKERWRQYRNESYSNHNIEQVIDSLANLLVSGGAEGRNGRAWKMWHCAEGDGPTYAWPNKYVSSSYNDEIDYLKNWIWKRLEWMDKELLYE